MPVLRIPRHACSPRDLARAGDLWRLVQEAAVDESSARGWPPSRYRACGTAFVVRELLGVHLAPAHYGDDLPTRTWVADARRDVIMRRETTLGSVLRTTVEWVHVKEDGGPSRAPRELMDAFPVELSPAPSLPAFTPSEPQRLPVFGLTPWYTEMDPLGHTNHPRYLDWVDEALSRWLAGQGVDPVALRPVAERLRFRGSATAGQSVEVHLQAHGHHDDATVFDVRILAEGEPVVTGVVHRAWS